MEANRPIRIDKIPQPVFNAFLAQASAYDTVTACHEVSKGRAYHLTYFNSYTRTYGSMIITYRGTVLDRLEARNG